MNSKTSAGVKTYAAELIKSLREIGGAEYEIIQDNPQAWRLPWWMNVTLANRIARSKPDVIHFTKSAIPWRKLAPTVVTVHDVIPLFFPDSQAILQRLFWPGALKHAVLQSEHVITVSEASKRDIVEYFQISPEKITVTPEAVDLEKFKIQGSKFKVEEKPYILFVGTRDMRKNVPLLIRAFARISDEVPHKLVIAGRQALKHGDDKRQAQELGLGERIRWLDFVPKEGLPALYAGADLFVWPSAYEGFGLPPMEAMASGVPVIVGNGGALPEVVGSAGEIVSFSETKLRERTWDMLFEEALAERILAVLEDASKRRTMISLGLERVKQFSWKRVAEKTLEVYKRVAAL